MSTNTKLAALVRELIDHAFNDGQDGLESPSQGTLAAESEVLEALAAHDAEQAQEPVLQDIEQYRMQMAGISTAALGYWKEGDSIHPDYDTVPLRDVAKLYAKYDELYKQRQAAKAVPAVGSPEASALIDSELAAYGWPANPKNAARAGYEACRKLMQAAPAPAAQAGDSGLKRFLALAEAAGIKSINDLPGLIPALQATEAQAAGQAGNTGEVRNDRP